MAGDLGQNKAPRCLTDWSQTEDGYRGAILRLGRWSLTAVLRWAVPSQESVGKGDGCDDDACPK